MTTLRCICGHLSALHRMGSEAGGCTFSCCDCTLTAPMVRQKAIEAIELWAWLLANEADGRERANKITRCK